jgi:uncharacterized repeat protein (TIGR01451 family)
MKTKLLFILLTITTFCSAQIVTIPDANLKAKLLSASPTVQIAKNLAGNYFTVDANSDGEIQTSEALQVSYLNLDCSTCSASLKINVMEGIQSFTNIKKLFCSANNISSIDVSALTQLDEFGIETNQITSLNVSNLAQLFHLHCGSNQIQNLDVSALVNLSRLDCSYNQLTSLDLSNCIGIDNVYCNNNQLSTINLQNLNDIGVLCVQFNQLTNINLNGITTIHGLLCYNNQLTTLDLSNQDDLTTLQCQNNQLTSLYVKNGSPEGNIVYPLNFSGNPNLQFICCDDTEEPGYRGMANNYGYTNCNVSSYCSFTPGGGTVYFIQGTQKFDDEINGCNIDDNPIPYFKYSISNGVNNGYFFADGNGSYNIPVLSGVHTVTPSVEHPTYFTVSPNNTVVNFPPTVSPAVRNFCIAPNGVHNDLEISILPLGAARPGLDARYLVTYKNNGTTTQSGSIGLNYNDATVDFVSATPTTSGSSANVLNWTFTNLIPFESRTIDVVFNLNSPLEVPSLNIGDFLNYTVSINGLSDETPNDNTMTLNQAVVNSYDPNDKTCLEGTTIPPGKVGDYVHYIIRFENNGTANAQNIVVKDNINSLKFDVNSLIPIKGSHNFETRISNTEKVEFIFQNINLPFDDANNDGYIAFKIKTKPTLVLGDTFSNSANIYFDYNSPITTNYYTTTVQNNLGVNENALSNDIKMYPNPVKDIVYFQTEETILKAEVYDVAGRIVSSNSVSEKRINISELKTGNYILKLYTEKGIMNTKIIKE